MRESKVENHLRKRCKEQGGDAVKVVWKGRRGAPDRLVMLPGWGPFVETKAPGGKPEPHQLRQHKKLRASGHEVWVLDTIPKVDAFIEHYIARKHCA